MPTSRLSQNKWSQCSTCERGTRPNNTHQSARQALRKYLAWSMGAAGSMTATNTIKNLREVNTRRQCTSVGTNSLYSWLKRRRMLKCGFVEGESPVPSAYSVWSSLISIRCRNRIHANAVGIPTEYSAIDAMPHFRSEMSSFEGCNHTAPQPMQRPPYEDTQSKHVRCCSSGWAQLSIPRRRCSWLCTQTRSTCPSPP